VAAKSGILVKRRGGRKIYDTEHEGESGSEFAKSTLVEGKGKRRKGGERIWRGEEPTSLSEEWKRV